MRIAGIAHRLPSRVITNEEVLQRVGEASQHLMPSTDLDTLLTWTASAFETAGTSIRYQLDGKERPYELCVEAAKEAMERAEVAPLEIDLVIYAGIGRGFIEPATANVFQDLLGLRNATCFDLLDACASWVRAVDVAHAYLSVCDGPQHILLINGEFLGRFAYRYALNGLNEFEHWFPGVTVGEAATATVLSRSDDDDYCSSFRTWGEKRGLCVIPLENYDDYLGQPTPHNERLVPQQFASFGGHILRFGASKLVAHFNETSAFSEAEYDAILGHSASDGVCALVGKLCNLDLTKFRYTHRLFGNTATASVPLALSTAENRDQLLASSRLLVLFASAGVSTALMKLTQH